MKNAKPRILLSGLLLLGVAVGTAFSQQGSPQPPADADPEAPALFELHKGPTSVTTIGLDGVVRCELVD